MHPTQTLADVSQTDRGWAQFEGEEPAAPANPGAPAVLDAPAVPVAPAIPCNVTFSVQSALTTHSTQDLVSILQACLSPLLQSALPTHSTHDALLASQTLSGATVQLLFAVQLTHLFFAASQIGVNPPHVPLQGSAPPLPPAYVSVPMAPPCPFTVVAELTPPIPLSVPVAPAAPPRGQLCASIQVWLVGISQAQIVTAVPNPM